MPVSGVRRGLMYPDEMMSLQLGKGWLDGRTGYLFCRIEAILDHKQLIRCEVTWMDDSEEKDNESGIATCYYDPEICLESNRIHVNNPESWKTHDTVYFPISGDEARMIVQDPSAKLLISYATKIAELRIWNGVGGNV